jgi:predicted RNase H-like HicB family nuclease
MKERIMVRLPATFKHDDRTGIYIARCPALEVYSQGETRKDAEEALQSAVMMYVQRARRANVLDEILDYYGFSEPTEGSVEEFSDLHGANGGKMGIVIEPIDDDGYVDLPFSMLAPNGR